MSGLVIVIIASTVAMITAIFAYIAITAATRSRTTRRDEGGWEVSSSSSHDDPNLRSGHSAGGTFLHGHDAGHHHSGHHHSGHHSDGQAGFDVESSGGGSDSTGGHGAGGDGGGGDGGGGGGDGGGGGGGGGD